MINTNGFTEGEGASHALVSELTHRLTEAESEFVVSGEGWGILPNGREIQWGHRLDEPAGTRGGTRTVREPDSLVRLVKRLQTEATTLWASREDGTVEALFDDDPVQGDDAPPRPGWRGDRAVLELQLNEDWVAWTRGDGMLYSQRSFGEFIEEQAHTVVEPDSATMLEVATTLTAKRTLDFSSRTRLDNGDVEFKFAEETAMKAGRGATSIEIPSTFMVRTPVWVGTPPVELRARLRVRPDGDGVKLGYKLVRVTDAKDAAFRTVCTGLMGEIGDAVPLFYGTPAA
jgi:uncharacterized protein YfdQ (DUF2303 family)